MRPFVCDGHFKDDAFSDLVDSGPSQPLQDLAKEITELGPGEVLRHVVPTVKVGTYRLTTTHLDVDGRDVDVDVLKRPPCQSPS
jgi:hypothetical protein